MTRNYTNIRYTTGDSASTVTTQIADKADITYVDAQIADKADTTYVDAQIASSIPSWETVTTNTTLVSGTRYIVDTSSTSVQLTLPSSPSIGDEVRLIDGTGNAATNNIILASTANIQGATDDLTITTNRAAFAVVYFDSTNGWLLMEI